MAARAGMSATVRAVKRRSLPQRAPLVMVGCKTNKAKWWRFQAIARCWRFSLSNEAEADPNCKVTKDSFWILWPNAKMQAMSLKTTNSRSLQEEKLTHWLPRLLPGLCCRGDSCSTTNFWAERPHGIVTVSLLWGTRSRPLRWVTYRSFLWPLLSHSQQPFFTSLSHSDAPWSIEPWHHPFHLQLWCCLFNWPKLVVLTATNSSLPQLWPWCCLQPWHCLTQKEASSVIQAGGEGVALWWCRQPEVLLTRMWFPE